MKSWKLCSKRKYIIRMITENTDLTHYGLSYPDSQTVILKLADMKKRSVKVGATVIVKEFKRKLSKTDRKRIKNQFPSHVCPKYITKIKFK